MAGCGAREGGAERRHGDHCARNAHEPHCQHRGMVGTGSRSAAEGIARSKREEQSAFSVESPRGCGDITRTSVPVLAALIHLPPHTPPSLQNPDPCLVQMTAAGFVGDEAAARISSELWQHLLEGQAEADGIPRRILAAMQLAAQAVQEERAALEKQGRKHKKEKRERRRRRDDDDSSSSSSGSRRRRRKEKKEKKEKRDGRSGSRHKDKEARGGGDKERRRRRREAS
eukprot:TRINITY_DN506_c0_g2_i2.p1 TRINITY_DN506_c0_g2~~TRINITY_DN506_c0_g2_i2.p1  ORF type:complete len:228 (+),score=45.40 TRINITY_DN506_c0_g2_i2:239-922(+)